jgi:putative alpha-1,2-mannosidase
MNNGKTKPAMRMERRNFLKGSAVALVGSTLCALPTHAAPVPPAEAPATPKNKGEDDGILAANPLQGTNSNFRFSRGNTLPIAAWPFGMAHWTIQSTETGSWMFDPSSRRVQGFRCTHQLSPWLADYGHAVFLPVAGRPKTSAQARSSSWRPEKSILAPHSFQLELLRYQITAELVPTERCAMLAARYGATETPGLVIEVPGKDVTFDQAVDKRSLRFKSTANSGGAPDNLPPTISWNSTRPGPAWNPSRRPAAQR